MTLPEITSAGDSSASSGQSSSIQTQIKLLQSRTVVDRAVRRLQSEPHPAAINREDLLSRLMRTLQLSHKNDLAYSALAADAATRIRVKPLGITRLVEVTCDSWNAAFSMKFCDTLIEEFKSVDLETREAEAKKASDFLILQVAGVRERVEVSQRKLEAATRGGNLRRRRRVTTCAKIGCVTCRMNSWVPRRAAWPRSRSSGRQ